jgi:hypothetical protein
MTSKEAIPKTSFVMGRLPRNLLEESIPMMKLFKNMVQNNMSL